MTKFSRGLVELNLSRTGLVARGISRVVESLQAISGIHLTLRRLDLSFNVVRGEEIGVSKIVHMDEYAKEACYQSSFKMCSV